MLWSKLAELPLVEACEYDTPSSPTSPSASRHTWLSGAGEEGLGEDVPVPREDGQSLHEARPARPLTGE
jgi:hypothetical protein